MAIKTDGFDGPRRDSGGAFTGDITYVATRSGQNNDNGAWESTVSTFTATAGDRDVSLYITYLAP